MLPSSSGGANVGSSSPWMRAMPESRRGVGGASRPGVGGGCRPGVGGTAVGDMLAVGGEMAQLHLALLVLLYAARAQANVLLSACAGCAGPMIRAAARRRR
jgi:hypothetical protein